MGLVGLVALAGVGPCADSPDLLGSSIEVSWVVLKGGAVVDCSVVGGSYVHIVQTDLQGHGTDEHDSDCGLGPTIVRAPDEWSEKVHVRAELHAAGGRLLATGADVDLDLNFETRATFTFDMGGAPSGGGGPDAGVPATVPCVYGPTDPTNDVNAHAVIDGRTVFFDGVCIVGEVDQAIGFDIVLYPSFIAVRQPTLQTYSEMFVELNPDRAGAKPTCDNLEVQGGMKGAGLVRFETTDILDSAGKPTQVESRAGGTFTVGMYSTAVGGRIAGSFDCPVGSPGGPARGSIVGSFDVRLQQ